MHWFGGYSTRSGGLHAGGRERLCMSVSALREQPNGQMQIDGGKDQSKDEKHTF